MNKTLKKTMFQSTIALLLILSLSIHVYSALYGNWRECLNTPGCTCETLTSDLSTYVVDSAGYFFNSHSAFQAFLNRVELAETNGIDAVELKGILYSAIDNMEKAKTAYANLIIISEKMPLNQALIDQLAKFDYTSFRAKYGLVESTFEKIKMFLSKGDIKGLDSTMLANMDNILTQQYIVKSSIDKGGIPDIAILWRLNQSYFEAQLFGQYMSEILKANL